MTRFCWEELKHQVLLSGFITYDFPINPWGTRSKAFYSKSKQNIVDGPFSNLAIEGESTFISGKITHPLVATKHWKVEGAVNVNYSSSENMLALFVLKNIGRKYTFEMNIYKQGLQGIWMGNIHFHRILKRDFTNNNMISRQWYSKWTVGLNRYLLLNRSFSIVGKLAGQYSPHFSLPISEQFQLGGGNNLSYESSAFSGDKGHSVQVELQYDAPWGRSLPGYFSTVDFKFYCSLQHGQAFPFRSDGSKITGEYSTETIALGLRSRITSSAYLELTLATPVDRNKHADQEKRHVLFSIQANF